MSSLQCGGHALAAVSVLSVLSVLLICCLCSYSQSSLPQPQPLGLLEALHSTLASHPELHIQEQQVIYSRGAMREASGLFDTTIGTTFSQTRVNSPLTFLDQQQAALMGIITSNQVNNVTLLDISATKEFRTGVSISPSLLATRTTDNINDIGGVNLSTLAFQMTVPLLRGRGRDVVDATEKAAGIEVEASLLDLNQIISTLLANTSSSYWNAVGAVRDLEVAQASEDRGKVYVDNVQTLISAGRVPEAEVNQVKANLATRSSARIAAEQALIAARQQLALAMGLSADRMENVGTPTEEFPKDDGLALAILDSHQLQEFFDLALERRADYLADKKREIEQKTLLSPARNATLPQLDLSLSSGYSSLSEGTGFVDFLRSPGRAPRGPDVGAAITYRFPPRNNAALGALMRAQSSARQAEQHTLQTSQAIMASVVTSVGGVRNSALQLQRAREAVASSQAALDGEREKYRLGVGQLVDVLTMEDRLTTAQQNQVTAELAYALALTRLRFATGSIVDPDKTVQSVDREVFLSVPIPAALKISAGKE